MKIEEILLKKAKENKLAHFYIVEVAASQEESSEKLYQFVHHFIRDYFHQIEGQKMSLDNLMDHPDVLVMGMKQDEKKEAAFYSVTEAEELSRFFDFRPVQSKRKFAVIPDAHRVNPTVANKWLKLLEEPPQEATIFLLNPRKNKLLATIHSRALHLRLSSPKGITDQTEWNDLMADLKEMGLSQFLENYSKGEYPLSFWMNELLQWESERNDDPEAKIALEKWVKTYEEMEIFHQPTATKWTLFYSHLKEHVLPRL